MFKTWRRPKPFAETSRQFVSRLSSAIVTRRLYPAARARSWNRLTILFYSSIISTAAAADVKAKQRRRRQWDVAFAEVKEFLQKPAQQSTQPPTSNGGNRECNDETIDSKTIPEQGGTEDKESIHAQRTHSGSQYTLAQACPEDPRTATRKIIRNSFFGIPGLSNVLAEKIHSKARVSHSSIYATSSRRDSRAAAWVPKKHVRVEHSVAKLATKFWIEAQTDTSSSVEQTQWLKENLRDLENRLNHIRKVDAFDLQGIERLNYPQYKSGPDDGTIKLNKALNTIISLYARGRCSYGIVLRKIAYYLLMSQSAPTTVTYCLMISLFKRLRQYRLVDMLIESMSECCMRHNEMSAHAVLCHYIRSRDKDNFHLFVRKIEGFDFGLMLARPGIPTDGVGSSRLRRHNDKIIQGITIDAHMACIIVRGYLSFGNKRQALGWINRMQEQGIRPDLGLLSALLRYYCRHRDWKSGSLIWEKIYAQFFRSSSHEYPSPGDQAVAFYSALQLCRTCGKPGEFRSIYRDGLSRGIPMMKLLCQPSPLRGFSALENLANRRSRAVRILERRVALLIEDNRNWTIHVLASKMLLSDLLLTDLEAMFRQFQRQIAYSHWLSERPWLLERKRA